MGLMLLHNKISLTWVLEILDLIREFRWPELDLGGLGFIPLKVLVKESPIHVQSSVHIRTRPKGPGRVPFYCLQL